MKRKKKEIQNVVGGEGDENGEENKREVWFGRQNRKGDETKVN